MESLDWLTLGNALRTRREAMGMPVETAGHQLCLAKSQIIALEAGKSENFPGAQARLWCTQRYAALLGIDLNDFAPPAESANDIVVVHNFMSETLPERRQSWRPVVLLAAFAAAYVWLVDRISPPESAPMALAPAPLAPATPAPVAVVAAPVPTPEQKPEPAIESIEVQGSDPSKSARYVFVSARKPAVLLRRNAAATEEERIELAQGKSMRIALASGDALRVVEGRDLDIFFQGRKTPAQAIERGLWLRFRAR